MIPVSGIGPRAQRGGTLAGLLGFGGSRWYFWVVWVLSFAAGGAGLAVHLVTISSPEVISGGEVLEVLARGADKAALAAFECASAAYGVGSEAWGGAAGGGGGGSNFTHALMKRLREVRSKYSPSVALSSRGVK